MISLVLVSHSRAIAEGTRDLVNQMTQGKVPIGIAGGIDDPDAPLGTDAISVSEAIQKVYSPEGVVVLIDLGSALMSAETALEIIDPDQRENVRICPAPLIEGAVAAGVQASVGGTLEQVISEAINAYQAKKSQFLDAEPESADILPEEGPGPVVTRRVTIPNRLGLHARPAARFVAIANRYDATVTIRRGDRTANAKSINQVVTLGVQQNETIEIRASGSSANAVLADLQTLIDNNLGDDESLPTTSRPGTASATGGIPASPGVAVGPALRFERTTPDVPVITVDDPQAEWTRLEGVIKTVDRELTNRLETLRARGQNAEAEIFAAHQLILKDPELLENVAVRVRQDALNIEAAWNQAIQTQAERYRQVNDEYIQARADDVQDVGRQVLLRLMKIDAEPVQIDHPAIIIAETLSPSDTVDFTPEAVLGILTAKGGNTSHSAIIARSLGIPAVVGVGNVLADVQTGQTVGMDGANGDYWLTPDEATVSDLRQQAADFRAEQDQLREAAREPAQTADGQRVMIAANIGSARDARLAIEAGAEGVGLFRTELIFNDRATPPTEDEQVAIYREVGEIMQDRPVIIRTLDIGGDKPVSYLPTHTEANPFLGWRGIRLMLDHPDVFKTQLRAILRAAQYADLAIMFPMVSTMEEVRSARNLIDTARNELRLEDQAYRGDIPIGIMIEVPAAVVIADHLAQMVDFFSIGTNDLTQYLMAADRGNARVSNLVDALNPAVLRLIKQAIDAAHRAGIPAYMCGELAGNPLAAPLLVGMGLDELSMGAAAIPSMKARIATLKMADAQAIVDKALHQPSAQAVQSLLSRLNKQ
jgi:multiphosphoryl transfer protein